MGESRRLRLKDVRSIYRLIGECRDLGADHVAWRTHLLSELCRLLDMQVGMAGETPDPGSFRCDSLNRVIEFGWPESKQQAHFWRFVDRGAIFSDPMIVAMGKLPPGKIVTRRQSEMVPKDLWYRSLHFNEYHREFGMDGGILSLQRLELNGRATMYGICMRRPLGGKPCTSRERRLLHWTHHELGPLIGRQLAAPSEPSPAHLPPHLHETLTHLLRGFSEKEAAARLGVTKDTAHNYVKSIYRHFGVRSRPELMALFLRRSTKVKPASPSGAVTD